MILGWPWDVDAATWVGSISTSLAVCFAAYAAYKTYQALELQRKHDRIADEDREREQASLVAHWRKLLPRDEYLWQGRDYFRIHADADSLQENELQDQFRNLSREDNLSCPTMPR